MKRHNFIRMVNVWIIHVFVLVQSLSAGTPDSVLYLEQVLKLAVEQNPGLHAAELASQAAEARISQPASLPDPQLTFGVMNLPVDSYDFNQEAMTQKVIGFAQSVPFFGKRNLMRKIAMNESKMINGQAGQTQLLLVRNVKNAYYRLAYIKQAIDIVDRNRLLLENLVEITKTRYKVGKGIQQDILKGQVQLLQEQQRIIELRESYQNTAADLNVLLNQLPQHSLPAPVQPPVKRLENDLKSLQESALQNNPLLKILMNDINRARAYAELAEKEYWPDFKISVTYGQREQRPGFLSAIVGLNIPLYFGTKQSQRVEETYLQSQRSLFNYDDQKNRLLRDVKNGIDEINKNYQLISLYKDEIIPHAEQTLNSSISAYQNDKVDFLTVINNQMFLLNQALKLEEIIRDYHQDIADLELFCGTPLL